MIKEIEESHTAEEPFLARKAKCNANENTRAPVFPSPLPPPPSPPRRSLHFPLCSDNLKTIELNFNGGPFDQVGSRTEVFTGPKRVI